ncbi:N-acetylglucosamine-6-phosphate deacetylase [Anaerophaga thermohalophila]|jgi:N-acetylglucosamine-6-phosphate deacetylase|uniref:N-acetylglucosamine-6-phosphate deacetylase n=1 Tax=Anaerophaga thermohalophila TaxID=177400 RepID=UPI0002FD0872|nr:N-acetylglucosamine-6-phosphate deacetylase [Anaerophaga thermohalophila]
MLPSFILKNGRIFDGRSFLSPGFSIVVKPPHILGITTHPPSHLPSIDLEGKVVAPGYIDLQVNGGGGKYASLDPSEKSFRQILNTHLAHGTTSLLLTIISSATDTRKNAIETIRKIMAKEQSLLMGGHLEGPFLNPSKKGAHHEPWLQPATPSLLKEITGEGHEVIKAITVSPELFTSGNLDVLMETGWILSAGHSNASYETAMSFFDHGGRMATHLYNTMSPISGREPGIITAIFEHPSARAGVIADGHHVHPAAIRLAHRVMGDRLFLISDATFLGQKDGEVYFGPTTFRMKNGICYNQEGKLAGSSISMAQAVQYCIKEVGLPQAEALRMASFTPAAVMGQTHRIGRIGKGVLANMVVLNDDWMPETVYYEGEEVEA